MAKYIRYTLAALCLAASVACLALWWRSFNSVDEWAIRVSGPRQGSRIDGASYLGYMVLGSQPISNSDSSLRSNFQSKPVTPDHIEFCDAEIASRDQFRVVEGKAICFPIWYASLVFALTGVAVLRFRRQFSIRMALVATTVVAALIGMTVTL